MTATLPSSWIPKARRIDHPERRRMRLSPARIKWACGARRSGKSTDGMDYLLLGHGPRDSLGMPIFRGALCPPANVVDPNYIIGAPTFSMVKRIWWQRLKSRLPNELLDHKPNETDLSLVLANGSKITCVGMDRPTRSEGDPIDGLIADEYAYWRPGAYQQSIRPALSTRGRPPGWAIMLFKPAGKNHAWESWDKAKSGSKMGQDAFHWPASVIIDPDELAAARDELDPRSYEQEYEASFLTQTGLVCYRWDANLHVRQMTYNPALPLVLTFDFNVSPGAAVVIQEQMIAPAPGAELVNMTCVLDEYYRADDSNTPLACRFLREKYREHKGAVLVYGDVGGNQRRTSANATDWEIVREELGKTFKDVRMRVGRVAPNVIDSVNALNSRLQSASGVVRFALDARHAEQCKRDFESVRWDDKKGEREIDKKSDKRRTHWFDAVRYYIHEAHPMTSKGIVSY